MTSPATTQSPLKGFAVIYEQKVEWGDMDAFNHVNNVVYYNYAQRARIHYLEQVDMFNLQTHTVIASSSCQYLNSRHFPRCALDWHSCQKIGNTSLTHDYVYFSTAQQNRRRYRVIVRHCVLTKPAK